MKQEQIKYTEYYGYWLKASSITTEFPLAIRIKPSKTHDYKSNRPFNASSSMPKPFRRSSLWAPMPILK